MEKFYELEDICLLPSATNNDHPGEKAVFTVLDQLDQTGIPRSLPIFTSPMESIVGPENAKMFVDNGIKPVLPLTVDIKVRLDYCQWIFCSFTMDEVDRYFLKQNRSGNQSQYHVNLDVGNGHSSKLLDLVQKLKHFYGGQMLIMAGNVGVAEVYSQYSRAGVDYMRIGIASSSLVDKDNFGFHYPMASLLESFRNFKKSGGIGLPKQVKIIADGGIRCFSDIIKALALGADYVMIGREFARCLEAYSTIYKNEKKDGKNQLIEVSHESVQGMTGLQAKTERLQRQYFGNTSPEIRAKIGNNSKGRIQVKDSAWEWINIDCTLAEWVEDFQERAYYALMMTGTLNWEDFKKNIRYGVV